MPWCHGILSQLAKEDSDDDWGIAWKGEQGSRSLIESGRLQLFPVMDVSDAYADAILRAKWVERNFPRFCKYPVYQYSISLDYII